MKLSVVILVMLAGCSITPAYRQADEAAKYAKASHERLFQLEQRVTTIEDQAASAARTSQENQRKITQGLRDVADILDKLTLRLATPACVFPETDPVTRVP